MVSSLLLHSLDFLFTSRGNLEPLVPTSLKMDQDFREGYRNVGGSPKKKRPSDYYFWVVDEVKNYQSLYSD